MLFKRNKQHELARFMASPLGRGIRVAAGLALITSGMARRDRSGLALAALGLVPLMAGALNLCMLAPLLDEPFDGSELR